MIIDKLINGIIDLQAPIVVGLDPRLADIPIHIKAPHFEALGKTPEAAAAAILDFNRGIIDAICDLVPAVKPQVAFYEQYGHMGFKAYIDTVDYAKAKGLVTIGDIKRGDIASTATAYSNGHIGMVDIDGSQQKLIDTDFVTINPYMGGDTIEPFLQDCKDHDRGLFALVKTSNKGSGDLQDIIMQDGLPLYRHVGKMVSDMGEGYRGRYGFSLLGAAVSARHQKDGKDLREALPHTFFLVPGYGAQGGKVEDLLGMRNKDGLGIIVNSSRGITYAYKAEKYSEQDYKEAARQAVIDMKGDLK